MFTGRTIVRAAAASAAALLTLTLAAGTASAGGPDCTKGNRVFRNGNVRRLTVVGLTADRRLVCFSAARPDQAVDIGPITGLVGNDTSVVGIDFRVQDGKLYGVGNAGGVYTLDPASGAATFVNSLTVALDGTAFGVDFNPVADRLRIISNTGQNLRHNVLTGATISDDTPPAPAPRMPLSYTAGMTALGVAAAGYTNNDLAASTATTLFDLDVMMDQVALQVPPNNGTLTATGKLGLDVTSAGFDVFSAVVDGVTVGNIGLAVLNSSLGLGFYEIDLLTGTAFFIDPFVDSVVDIAVPLAR
jgi:hypothetical protein